MLVQFLWIRKPNPLVTDSLNHPKHEPIQCAMISPNSSDGILKFDHKKNFAFCVGIDELHQPIFAEKRRELTIKEDATGMRAAFISSLGFNPDQVKLSISSDMPDRCTKAGLRASFLECIKKVEHTGIFIFYYAGHGYEWEGRCLLTPGDFASDVKSAISGEDLVEWLDASKCKEINVLFIFDCCYSGDLGEGLTYHSNLKFDAHLYAMCGCGAKECLTSISALNHSIFTYFLLDYMTALISEHKKEIIFNQMMDDVAELCFRFSSLIMVYVGGKLHCGSFNLMKYHRNASITEHSNTNAQAADSLLNIWFKNIVRGRPHEMVEGWLHFKITQDSLKVLSIKVSSLEIQNGIVSALLYSSALLHYEHEDGDGRKLLENRNLFLQITTMVLKEIPFSISQLIM